MDQQLDLADDAALAQVALEVTSSLRLGDVLRAVTAGLVSTLGVEAAYLWLGSSAAPRGLELAARAGLDPGGPDPPDALARLTQPDEHLCTNDIPHDGSSGSPEWLDANGLRAVAGYPLTFRGVRLGVLGIFSRRRLTTLAFRRLFLFAQQAAVAVQNALLFTEVETLRERLSAENAYLRSEPGGDRSPEAIVGVSPAMHEVLRLVEQVASAESTVLLEGETGTGKEVIATAIHQQSRRAGRVMVKLNCGAISPHLLESELFGQRRRSRRGMGTRPRLPISGTSPTPCGPRPRSRKGWLSCRPGAE